MLRAITAMLIATLSAVALAQAPANPPVRVRGTVEKLDGQMLTVKARDGKSVTVKMTDKFLVMGVVRAKIDDIGAGKFIGTTTLGERDGALVALEIHIFPESMRGTGEGHYDWDLQPTSKMTNANVATIKSMGKDHVMEVQYKGGEKKVIVPDTAVIVSYTPSDVSALTPGAPVFINSTRQPDGTLTSPRVNVGLNGQAPPM
jgi:hypothetical protein